MQNHPFDSGQFPPQRQQRLGSPTGEYPRLPRSPQPLSSAPSTPALLAPSPRPLAEPQLPSRPGRPQSGTGVVAFLLTVFAILIVSGVLISSGSLLFRITGQAQGPARPVQPSVGAQPLTPTPVIFPATHGRPQLGALLSDFVGAYGQQPVQGNGSYDFLQHSLSLFVLSGSPTLRVYGITLSIGWASLAEARTACKAFLPEDSQYQQQVEISDGQRQTGTQRIYLSPSLASLFPANDFIDNQGKKETPGTFSLLFTDDLATADHVSVCSFQLSA